MSIGNLAEAEQMWKRSLAIKQKVLGSDHIDLCSTLANMGVLCKKRGMYAEALSWFNKALVIKARVLGSGHPDVCVLEHEISILQQLVSWHCRENGVFDCD